jgi:PAS domain S-box-containing protein
VDKERSTFTGKLDISFDMLTWLSSIFDTAGFSPRWQCGGGWLADPGWGWLHIVSDLATFTAYTAIPLVFIYFLRKRPDLPLPRLWWLFATFIFACGTVHLLEAVIFWWPAYRLSGIVKFTTAIASWATVLALLPVVPAALTFRSPIDLEQEVRDRTVELLAANRQIRESDEWLRLALSAGRMGTWNWNLKTGMIWLDSEEIALTGLGRREHQIQISQFLERVHRDDREGLDQALHQCIKHGQPYTHTFRLYVPEKGFRWLQGRGTVTRDSEGDPERMVGVNFDITEQMADQEALRVRNRAVECATNGIIIADIQSDDHSIVYVNPAFEALTGYRKAEVSGRNITFLQGPRTDPEASAELQRAIAAQEECEVTLLNYRKDGTTFWNHFQIAPVENEQETVTHFVGVLTEVTDRVQNEQRLIEAQSLAESASRAKSEFLANMSHEIRTPMTAILGCADTLCRELRRDEPRETAKTIRGQGQLLLGLLNDILDLSKIEAGKLEVHTQPCNLLSLIADVRSLMDPQVKAKGLTLKSYFDSPIPEQVQTDPLRFRQVLLNLVSNAIKFTESGHVEIRVRCTSGLQDRRLAISVRDTGVGIPDDRLQAIFEAFTQVDPSPLRRAGGTGLGLTICQHLTTMLGGKISVESQVNRGSTFTVTIPVEPGRPVEVYSIEELTQRREQKESTDLLDIMVPARVLVAEDTAAIQFMLRRILEPVVTSVSLVENGKEAIAAVTRGTPDLPPFELILMDMQMPVMNGYDATARLRAMGYDLPIIALTAGAMAGDRERCLEAGCTDYLAKPVSLSQLQSMIQTYCKPQLPKRT